MPSGKKKKTATASVLDLVGEDDVRQVSLTFGITLYTDKIFTEIADAVIYCHKKFLELCPNENFKFYSTTNMKMDKPVTSRALNMLSTWLKPDAPSIDYIGLHLKDGKTYQDAPKFSFKVFAKEKGAVTYKAKDANLIAMAFPPEWGEKHAPKLLEFVHDLCSTFPFLTGHAGFSFECSPYEEEMAHTYAWKKTMRFRGIDISRVPEDAQTAGHVALKGVGWLTILNMDFIQQLGGIDDIRRRLSEEVELVPVTNGYIFKAGKYPSTGDWNRKDFLQPYQDVYSVVKPLVEEACERSLYFNLDDDYDEIEDKMNRWYRRFEVEE
ncbi:hypothetical protein GMJAKD_02140 [Candidatus Electrothrix aarhusensis]